MGKVRIYLDYDTGDYIAEYRGRKICEGGDYKTVKELVEELTK